MTRNDLDRFWADDELAHRDNCFFDRAPQVALGIRMSDECVYAELGEDGDPWAPEDPARRYDLNRRYNDKAESVVGRRLLAEVPPEEAVPQPAVRRIGEVFEGTYERGRKTGEWLHSPASTPAELEAMLDRVDRLDLAEFMLPDDWADRETTPLLRHIRGPVTLATSIYGVEELIFLYFDAPELFERFSATIARVVLEMAAILDREAGYTEETRPRGFSFADDDCNLLTPEMYELFGFPILKRVFDAYSPDPGDKRFQHSDSAMAHIVPILGRLDLNGCNFGPTVLVDDIRPHLPRARIDGCLAPFTFMNNDRDGIVAEVRRDCEAIRRSGTKGLNVATAGSINNGSSLESMLLVMETIVEYGRY
ncbi:MAG: uroporphyrinogen decarboxylase family protein [bacterium]